MSYRVAPLALVLACHTAVRPETGLVASPRQHLIGSSIKVVASWEAQCKDWGASFQSIFNKNDDDPKPEPVACKEKPFAVKLSCSTRCEHTLPSIANGVTTIDVVPLELGPLTIEAVSQRMDTGEVHRVTLPQLVIALPDRLELRCWVGKDAHTKMCGPDGVPADHPVVTPLVHIAGATEVTTALEINGVRVPADFAAHPHVSLADLYPDARRGDGIEPGHYRVELAVGAVKAVWEVTAR